MSEQQLQSALSIRDPYVLEGLAMQQLSLEFSLIMGEIGELLERSGRPRP